LASAQERERNAAEQYRQISGKTAALEAKMTNLGRAKNDLETKLDSQIKQCKSFEEIHTKDASVNDAMKRSLGKEVADLKRNLVSTN
jgi:uncharacterized protein involved in exopolysaccharide biosynthesis